MINLLFKSADSMIIHRRKVDGQKDFQDQSISETILCVSFLLSAVGI